MKETNVAESLETIGRFKTSQRLGRHRIIDRVISYVEITGGNAEDVIEWYEEESDVNDKPIIKNILTNHTDITIRKYSDEEINEKVNTIGYYWWGSDLHTVPKPKNHEDDNKKRKENEGRERFQKYTSTKLSDEEVNNASNLFKKHSKAELVEYYYKWQTKIRGGNKWSRNIINNQYYKDELSLILIFAGVTDLNKPYIRENDSNTGKNTSEQLDGCAKLVIASIITSVGIIWILGQVMT